MGIDTSSARSVSHGPSIRIQDLLRASATELAAAIRSRVITSRAVVEAHIAHIRRVNPVINAVVRDRFAEALAEADRADARTRSSHNELPPFHGVPCTIKEAFALTGMPNSSGLVSRRDTIADSDATAVARLRAAGAIPLGVTNISELCMWMESDNKVYGRTRNPYDSRRTVGGSSGGEGAIVGAGGAPFGLGSDIGGSIRMPAFFNGVFGHKPSGGLVPGSGQYPVACGVATRYLTTGPICRRAADLFPLLRILAGPDDKDPGCRGEHALGDPNIAIEGLDVLSVEGNGVFAPERSLLEAQRRVARHLERNGARVRVARIEDLRHSLDIWSAAMAAAEGPSFAELMGEGVPVRAGRELLQWIFGRSDHTLPAIGLALAEKLPALLANRSKRALELASSLKERLAAEIGPRGIMLYPSYPKLAPLHGTALLPPIQFTYTAILNVLEMPATQVPLGLHRGLPLGVQVAATPGNDHITIGVACELERAFGGWVPPARFFTRV
jgi:fatty acid amide hydrolase 2